MTDASRMRTKATGGAGCVLAVGVFGAARVSKTALTASKALQSRHMRYASKSYFHQPNSSRSPVMFPQLAGRFWRTTSSLHMAVRIDLLE